MKAIVIPALLALFFVFLSGCGQQPAKPTGDDKIKAERAKLSDDDQKLVAAQEFCAVENKNHLGAMGPPVKIMVKDQPVFLCCKGCKDEALKDPDETLKKVAELKEKAKK